MKSKRIIYALLVIVVIALGIISRKVTAIPLIAGDILYAVMMFLLIKFLLIQLRSWRIALISLSICYFIEISQLYHAPWINQIRNTTIGALVLGHGFLWSDMIAYTIGTAIVYFITLSSSRGV
jgi:hypothetical protein